MIIVIFEEEEAKGSRTRTRTRKDMTVYDPCYCNGRTKTFLEGMGGVICRAPPGDSALVAETHEIPMVDHSFWADQRNSILCVSVECL